jgi:hypothetical protein
MVCAVIAQSTMAQSRTEQRVPLAMLRDDGVRASECGVNASARCLI